ncbi:hypothetical protein EHI47_11780 [Rhizobium leguminosarum]|jgi:hypothetical protein|uniref:Tail fiber assembly protein n=1 Tax=Rhizobium leguminosarum TaxID=384 RepID=A0A444I3D6_RHILE|nr:hypothetical protein [Rhizobium leguminosarum]RWX32055.1 hypothetical protein EHI47_11780 [Rhizobium leguminosarum]
MKSALVKNGAIDTISFEPQKKPWIDVADDVFAGFVKDGTGWKAPPSEPVAVDDYQHAIQRLVDEKASARRYNSGDALASYVASTVPAWKAEAEAFVAWRDAVWQYAYAELAKVQAEARDQPSIADFLLELPEIVWPNS